ncbi:MAG: hypothetical protein ACL93V_03940 [Candidatus Electrothrix sp. YB6]
MSKKYQNLIYRNVLAPLSSVPFHSDCSCIERAVAEEFPVHLAIHRITKAQGLPQKYVELHEHNAPEINILIGDEGEMEYQFQLEDEIYHVRSPASIWIPSELKHAANLIKGSGTYVCVILSGTYVTQ